MKKSYIVTLGHQIYPSSYSYRAVGESRLEALKTALVMSQHTPLMKLFQIEDNINFDTYEELIESCEYSEMTVHLEEYSQKPKIDFEFTLHNN